MGNVKKQKNTMDSNEKKKLIILASTVAIAILFFLFLGS